MKITKIWFRVSGLALLSLSACSPLKDLSDMHKSTTHMDSTTTEMNGTTGAMALDMKEMLKVTNEVLAARISSMDEKVGAMTEVIDRMGGKMDKVDNHMESMSGKIDHMDASMQDLGVDIKTMLTKITGLTDYMGQMLTAMNGMNAAIVDMHQDMKDMRGDIKGMAAQITTLSTSIVAMHDTMKLMNTNIGSMQTDMREMKGDIKTMSGQMITLAKNMSEMYEIMKTMGAAITTMSGQMAEVHTDMKDMSGNLSLMLGKMTGLLDNMVLMYTTMTKMNDNIVTMAGQMTGVSTDMKAVVTVINDLGGKITTMASQISSLTGYIKTMSDQMVELVGSMAVMTNQITQMNVTLDLTHSDLRLIFLGQHRMETLAALREAKDQTAKFGYASEYMLSQTFQAWNVNFMTTDTPAYRLELMAITAQDFLFKMADFIDDRNDVGPKEFPKPRDMDRFAIAATLDVVNSIQLDGLKKYGVDNGASSEKPISMLQILENGIAAKSAINAGTLKASDIPAYQNEVLKMESNAVYLLRLRQNFLKGVAAAVADARKNGNAVGKLGQMWDVIMARAFHKSWRPNLGRQNASEIEAIAVVLDLAAETQKFLIDQNINPMTKQIVANYIECMKPNSSDQAGSAEALEHLKKSIATIEELDRLERQKF